MEGDIDEAVARRLVAHVGAHISVIHVKHGKEPLLSKLAGYNAAARHAPWLVLLDLDHDADCAPAYVEQCVIDPAHGLCFRVAVRTIEAWLLGDRERIARFLSVPLSRVPGDPEGLPDPKAAMVELARDSRRRDVRDDMVPRAGSGRRVGPAYNSRLIEFAGSSWRLGAAMASSPSLRRSVVALRGFAARQRAVAAAT